MAAKEQGVEGMHLSRVDPLYGLRSPVFQGLGHAVVVLLQWVSAAHGQESGWQQPAWGLVLDDAEGVGEARVCPLSGIGQVAILTVIDDRLGEGRP